MVFFVIFYCFTQSQVPQHRAIILAVGDPAEPLDNRLRRHSFCPRESHAAVFGRHERHHRGRGYCRCAAEGAPHALADAPCVRNPYPHRHHVAAGRAADDADTVRHIIFFVKQYVARIKEVVLDRLAIQPVGAVAKLDVSVHIVAVRADRRVRRSTMPGKMFSTYSSSSLVVCLPRVNRILPCAISAVCPNAKSTCDGCRSYAEQAEPVDASTRCLSSMSSIDSPSIYGIDTWTLFGRRSVGWPLSIAFGIFLSRRSIKKSRRAVKHDDSAERSLSAFLRAAAKPTISGTLSVPARRCCSCSPPTIRGTNDTPFFL